MRKIAKFCVKNYTSFRMKRINHFIVNIEWNGMILMSPCNVKIRIMFTIWEQKE